VVIVDVVTGRYENLYTLLLDSLGVNHDPVAPRSLYAAACRSLPPEQPAVLESWFAPLTIGAPLPTLPLWLEAEHAEHLDLEHSYAATFGELRIPT
jgi:hypothetical protein